MAHILIHEKELELQLSSTSINLNVAIVQLQTWMKSKLQLDERAAEAAYYHAMVSAYSYDDSESEELSEALMEISLESDQLTKDLYGKAHE